MPNLTAFKELRYGGRTLSPGTSFDATEKDAKLLRAIGKAGDAVAGKSVVDLPDYEPVDPRRNTMDDTWQPVRAAKSEPLAETDDDPKPQGGRGQYQRRDMTAEPGGQTGQAKKSPSSRPGRRSKAKT